MGGGIPPNPLNDHKLSQRLSKVYLNLNSTCKENFGHNVKTVLAGLIGNVNHRFRWTISGGLVISWQLPKKQVVIST